MFRVLNLEKHTSIQISTQKEVALVRFTPLGERLIVRPIEQEEKTSSGIILPDTAKEKPQEGEVVAVGPGRTNEDGKRVPMEVKAGDRVIYSKFAGTEYKEAGQEYLILRESDVLAKVSK
jgi:chaperonin GroES